MSAVIECEALEEAIFLDTFELLHVLQKILIKKCQLF